MSCSSQTNRFCSHGQLDSAVRTNDGRIFVFFGSYLTELNHRLEVQHLRPIPISNIFKGLDFNRIDAAFTADGQNNPNAGKTYLIRGKVIKEFSNVTATGVKVNIDTWKNTTVNSKRVNLVINQFGDSTALFFKVSQKFTQWDDIDLWLFDSIKEPSEVSGGQYVKTAFLIDFKIRTGLLVKAVIGLSNNSYLVLYNPIDRTANGKYCFTQTLSLGVNHKQNYSSILYLK